MKKCRNLLLLTVCLLSFIVSCVKIPDSPAPSISISISSEVLHFADTSGSQTLTINSNSDWTISGTNANCSVSPSSGKKNSETIVIVTISENIDTDREFYLNIKAGEVTKKVTIKQPGKNYANDKADIIVTEFSISPKYNNSIYSEIEFIKKIGSVYEFTSEQVIKYYKTDLTTLKASWKSNTSKVTIAENTQKSGITVNNFSNLVTYRFYAKNNTYIEYSVKLSNPENSYSGLPLLVLTTNDNTDITSKEDWKGGKFKIDPQGNSGINELSGETDIKGRGNSTWNMPKKPYNLKLKEKSAGTFLGMNPHKRWVLLANYADKTGLRNKVTFEIGKHSNLKWTPDSRFVEVILNGKFLGNYLLTEQIKIDSKRVNIEEVDNTETNSEKITGGWLLEIDRYYSFGETRYFRPTISQIPVIVKEPEDANSTQMNYIQNFFNQLEKFIFPDLPQNTKYHSGTANLAGTPDTTKFNNLLDISTFIDFWLIQELTGNEDSRLPGSVYMYKDTNGKLCAGPLWDFDQTTYLGTLYWMHYDYIPNEDEYNSLEYRTIYFRQLFKDPKFKARAKDRWNEFYNYLLNDVPDFIDNEYAKIAKSQDINWIEVNENSSQGIWAISEDEKIGGGRNHDKHLTPAEAVTKMKNRYMQRLLWLNNQISTW
ncbi:MAG: hypothetical protein CVT93_08560 [Bacteroidetes bacterium HGW-Bacteroidetes-10]|nr:MAG: hypothetical protein CVT93_08560 [Bacteroidetes bacterium HGW-Bacteroidetes-10]